MSLNSDLPQNDEEKTIPRAAMNKMIKEILPNIRVAIDARELILQCCTEFIHLLSSESNEICNKQQKKTINAEHILMCKIFIQCFYYSLMNLFIFPALDNLGFGDYKAEAEAVMRDCKAVAAKKRRKNTRLENLGIPEEELLRQQQELFAKVNTFLLYIVYYMNNIILYRPDKNNFWLINK